MPLEKGFDTSVVGVADIKWNDKWITPVQVRVRYSGDRTGNYFQIGTKEIADIAVGVDQGNPGDIYFCGSYFDPKIDDFIKKLFH